MESKFLTQEELSALQELKTQQADLITSLGQIEYQILLLNSNKDKMKDLIKELESKSENLGRTLTEKYGSGNINLESGEITAS